MVRCLLPIGLSLCLVRLWHFLATLSHLPVRLSLCIATLSHLLVRLSLLLVRNIVNSYKTIASSCKTIAMYCNTIAYSCKTIASSYKTIVTSYKTIASSYRNIAICLLSSAVYPAFPGIWVGVKPVKHRMIGFTCRYNLSFFAGKGYRACSNACFGMSHR